MSIDADEEILQDFIIEASEILETLSEELVSLENNPQDMELLNSIFRGFHTVKGGAGFLNLIAMVEVCHVTENIFDILRNGGRVADSNLMDAVLKALDYINTMFDEVKAAAMPTPVPQEFLNLLATFAQHSEAPEEIDQSHHFSNTEATESTSNQHSMEEISDDEFESLLDELHGQQSTEKKTEAKTSPKVSDSNTSPSSPDASISSSGESISDDEFEALLDQLHGVGKAPVIKSSPSQSSVPNSAALPPTSKPESVATSSTSSVAQVRKDSSENTSQNASTQSSAQPDIKDAVNEEAAAIKKSTPMKAMNTDSTVRVDTARLDDIMNMVGELVLARNRLKMLGQNYQDESLNKALSTLDVVTSDLQGAVMKTRMQPIKKVFGRFPRVVRDLARNLNKEVSLMMIGEDTDLDKNLVEALADPLVHLVRNSVDHGVETPDERESTGKARTGRIILSASQEGDHILLSIEDDGKGMDPNVLRDKAVEKRVMNREQADRLTDNEAFNLIFNAGFSTKDEISDVSGRGVGMDVVKTKITQLNGTINIDSQLGRGTIIYIKVPLTLAILPTLMVTVGKQSFAFPLASVNEIFHLDLTKTNVVDGQETIIVRDKALPLFYLEQWLLASGGTQVGPREQGHVVIVQVGTQKLGFVVDSLVGQEEVVIKPLGLSLQGTPGMAGATITSDGGIALILDIPSMLKFYARRS